MVQLLYKTYILMVRQKMADVNMKKKVLHRAGVYKKTAKIIIL